MKALIFVSAMCLLSMVNSLQIHDAHWGHCEKDGTYALKEKKLYKISILNHHRFLGASK